jgi:hypothetical protein
MYCAFGGGWAPAVLSDTGGTKTFIIFFGADLRDSLRKDDGQWRSTMLWRAVGSKRKDWGNQM